MRLRRSVRWVVVLGLGLVPLARIPDAGAATLSPTLVQAIQTFRFSPGSPDPAGIAYLPGSDRMMVADSEVEEVTGAGWHNANLWNITRSGSVQYTGDTTSYTKEPTGLSFDPAGGRLFISSDSGDRVHIITAGGDGRFGTADDARQTILASDYGSTDTEDVAYNPNNGHLYIAGGTGVVVIDVDPRSGGFGNGDDTWTSFSMTPFGGRDTEGIGYDGVRNTLVVADRGTKTLYETSLAGNLLNSIPLSGISGLRYPADVEIAPASDGSGRRTYWVVDREIDNGSDPNENDGMLWEVAIPGGDAPPTVQLTSPAAGATVSGSVSLSANAGDDNGVSKVDFLVDGVVVASDTSASGGWTGTWDSASVADGSRTVTARATDTIGQTANDSRTVTVDNTDDPPTVALTSPADGAAVTGVVSLGATASDDKGVTQVEFLVDGVVVATDTSATGGWTAGWDSAGATEGPHTLAARATDTKPQTTTSATRQVTVDRTAPAVSITAPGAGSTLVGTVTVTANATDAGGVASVEFFADGTSIGTDASATGGWSMSWNTAGVGNGAHQLTARANDRAGNQATSAGVPVTVDNPLVVDVAIATGSDDAEEKSNTNTVLTSTDLDMMTDGGTTIAATGLRFDGVNLPRGASITNAWIQFTTDETWTNDTTLTITGQEADDPATFAATKRNVTSRLATPTSSIATWNVPLWSVKGERGNAQRTPQLAGLIQELTSQSWWDAGDAMVFVITGSGRRVAKAFEGGAAVAPLLHVEYEMP